MELSRRSLEDDGESDLLYLESEEREELGSEAPGYERGGGEGLCRRVLVGDLKLGGNSGIEGNCGVESFDTEFRFVAPAWTSVNGVNESVRGTRVGVGAVVFVEVAWMMDCGGRRKTVRPASR